MEAKFYLKNLIIQNFATFKNQKINFRPGFNVIVGETGSGKSLLLDALQLILGGRADKKVVRRETEFALIEASFYCKDPAIKQFLEQEGYPIEGSELIIKRLIYRTGLTKNYFNHLSCTLAFLSHFSRKYVDVVGQFENQKLLSEVHQLHLLDQFGMLLPELKEFQGLLHKYKEFNKSHEDLLISKNHREQRLDYLNFQLLEIEKLAPSSQDEEDLIKKKHMMLNLEKMQKLEFQVGEFFDGSDGQQGLSNQLRALGSILRRNQELFRPEVELLAEVEDRLNCLKDNLNVHFCEDLDPADLEFALDRLDLYQKLKKKFGGTVEGILQSQIEFTKEKAHLEELEISLEGTLAQISEAHNALTKLGEQLHQRRLGQAKLLGDQLTQKVKNLKMQGATLRIDMQKVEDFMETGMTKVHFLAETNKGEGFFKIKDIASGGELSRILLGLRQLLSSHDSISIFLFDEIDTGIGGETATCIGRALHEVSEHGQVLAITHLPQIAQYAEKLIVVNKETHSSGREIRTESSVKEIIGKTIMKEVRTMAQLN